MRSRLMTSALFSAAILAGCNKEESASPTNPATKPATTNPAAATIPPAVSAAADDAMKKLGDVKQYLADKKFDMADKALKELEDHKSSLPAAVADKLGNLRTMVDAGKAGSAIPTTMPVRMPTTLPAGLPR